MSREHLSFLELKEAILEEAKKYRITKSMSNKSLGRLMRRGTDDEVGKAAHDEHARRNSHVFGSKEEAHAAFKDALSGKHYDTNTAKRIINTLGIHHKSKIATSLMDTAKAHETKKADLQQKRLIGRLASKKAKEILAKKNAKSAETTKAPEAKPEHKPEPAKAPETPARRPFTPLDPDAALKVTRPVTPTRKPPVVPDIGDKAEAEKAKQKLQSSGPLKRVLHKLFKEERYYAHNFKR